MRRGLGAVQDEEVVEGRGWWGEAGGGGSGFHPVSHLLESFSQ